MGEKLHTIHCSSDSGIGLNVHYSVSHTQEILWCAWLTFRTHFHSLIHLVEKNVMLGESFKFSFISVYKIVSNVVN